MEKVKKIDIHAHVCVFPEFFPREIQNLITVDELIKTYDDIGVEKGVLLPLTSGEGMVSRFPPNRYAIYSKSILTDFSGSAT